MDELTKLIEENKVFVESLGMEVLPVSVVKEVIGQLYESYQGNNVIEHIKEVKRMINTSNIELRKTLSNIAEDLDGC